MKKLLSKYNIFFSMLVLAAMPSGAFAAFGGPFFTGCNMDDPQTGDVECIITNVTNWALDIVGLICVLMIMIGGARYIVSAGNQSQTEGAKKTIVGALIGLIIVIFSTFLVNLVIKFFH